MHYHVRITRQRDKKETVKLDLTEQHDWTNIEQIRLTRTDESSEDLRPMIKAERERKRRESHVVSLGGPSLEWYIAASGEDVTDDFLSLTKDAICGF